MNFEEYNRNTKKPGNKHNKKKSTAKRAVQGKGNSKKREKSLLNIIRWDKIIGFAAVVVLIVAGVIVLKDFNGNSINAMNNKVGIDGGNELENMQGASLPQSANGKKKTVVCIDAGHGGKDGGAEHKGILEKNQALEISLLVKKYLEAEGIEVVMTRTTDIALTLDKRVEISNSADADVLVSIHRNYFKQNTSVKGIEAWILNSAPKNAQSLAGHILSELGKMEGVVDRGVKSGTMDNPNTNYAINSGSKCSSCIVELGFLTNDSDTQLVTKNKEKSAKSIAQGILNYLKEMRLYVTD